jgi:hypothetical protein
MVLRHLILARSTRAVEIVDEILVKILLANAKTRLVLSRNSPHSEHENRTRQQDLVKAVHL